MVKSKSDMEENEETNIFRLLGLYNLAFIKQEIFLYLDFTSLHTARQVCKEWDKFIMERIWCSSKGVKQMERQLESQWRTGQPHKRNFDIQSKGFYLAVDEKEVGLGTLDNKALVLRIDSGHQVHSVQCQGDEVVERLERNQYISEVESVQLDMTDQVMVTVTGCGVVTVWDRATMEMLYREAHHGYEPVLGVRAVGDTIVTGGISGSLAVLSVFPDIPRVRLECVQREWGQRNINHLDCDEKRVLVGTDRDMMLWDLGNRTSPKHVSSVPAKHVCCCVLFYPYAACTGLFQKYGVQVWDLVKGIQLRYLHFNLSMWVVQVKGNILATSMSSDLQGTTDDPRIFLHDIRELTDSNISDKDLWTREISCPREDINDPHIAINKTCLFSVTKRGRSGAKVTVWDFWSYTQQSDWDMNTFLNDGTMEII